MGMYEVVLGIGTIIFLSLVWIVLMHPFSLFVDSLSNMTNSTEVKTQYDIAENIFYFSYFFIAILVFVWIIKESVKHQEREYVYG
mgnify:CR=1 FL=1